jgi:hypothetical protein
VTTQAEQPLPVLAKGVQSDGDGSSVGPEDLVTFIADVFALPIFGGISSKKYSQCACHP